MKEEKVQPETCMVQPAVHRKNKGPVAVIPNKILERKDLALLAIGSAACLRGVYLAIAPSTSSTGISPVSLSWRTIPMAGGKKSWPASWKPSRRWRTLAAW